MKIPRFILSFFGKAVTHCDFCNSTFTGGHEEGYIWLGHHSQVCFQTKEAFRKAFLAPENLFGSGWNGKGIQ